MIEFGDWGGPHTAEAVLSAMALGHIDYYVLKPWGIAGRVLPPHHHRVPARVAAHVGYGPPEVEVVGERWSPKVHELTHAADPQRRSRTCSTRATARRAGASCASAAARRSTCRSCRLLGKRILMDPSREELAGAYGVTHAADAADATST